MKTLSSSHRKAVNRAVHAYSLRVELQTRDRWIGVLTKSLEAGALNADIHATIAQLAEPREKS